jgi:DNA polymerase V
MKVVPIYIEAGITGFESPAAEYQEMGLSLDELLVQNPNATFIGVAKGESMTESGIFDGDVLIVDRSLQAKHMDVIVCNFNGAFVCKILDKHNKLLLSSSEHYKPVPITTDDEFQVEGVVPFSIRVHRASPLLLP